jgi:NADPH-dependent 7-cyano-7-deazaguanine reductase QueF
MYLGSFRNHAIFHEGVVQTVFDRCRELLGDVPIRVHGDFTPRGGVKIVTTRSHRLDEVRALD